jgi:hypothetical protein
MGLAAVAELVEATDPVAAVVRVVAQAELDPAAAVAEARAPALAGRSASVRSSKITSTSRWPHLGHTFSQPRRARTRSSWALDILDRPSIPRSFASS